MAYCSKIVLYAPFLRGKAKSQQVMLIVVRLKYSRDKNGIDVANHLDLFQNPSWK